MNREAQASNIDSNAIFVSVGDVPQTRQTKSLDGYARCYAYDRKKDKREEIDEYQEASKGSRVDQCHCPGLSADPEGAKGYGLAIVAYLMSCGCGAKKPSVCVQVLLRQ